jgi:ribokinase
VSNRTALFVGDIGQDTSLRIPHVPGPDEKVVALEAHEAAGGVVANAAVACHRAEASSRLLCATGDDLVGSIVVKSIRTSGVEISSTERPGPTCRALIVLEPSGEKRLVLVPGVSMYPSVDEVGAADLHDVGWVHTAAYDHAAAAALAQRCRDAGIPWSVDLEPATVPRDLLDMRQILYGADTVFVNTQAAGDRPEPIETTLRGWGVRSVVLSLGSQGARLITDGIDEQVAPPPGYGLPDSIKDTTGAGDCLAGWYVAERLRGVAALAAVRAAVAAATLSCLRIGAQQSYPNRAAVDAALRLTNH